MNENLILRELDSNFIIRMRYAFQDRENLYLAMPNLGGGDLRFHIIQRRVFDERETRFFMACIIAALEHVHSKGILHRDLKPENLVFDDAGYLYLTDFGVSKYWRPENSEDTSGTPGYMAPEVLCRRNHSYSVDYYALGVMMYECMVGKRPYLGKTRKEIKEQVLAKQATVKTSDVVGAWSPEAIHLCNALLQRKRVKRLGENGPNEIKCHPFFKGFNWDEMSQGKMRAPFVPPRQDNFDRNNAARIDEFFELRDLELLKKKSVQTLFLGYEYDERVALAHRKTSELSYFKSTAVA